jgi:hypothetical protein
MCHHKLENLLAIPPFTSWSLVKSVLVLQNLVPIGDVKTTDNKLHYKKNSRSDTIFFWIRFDIGGNWASYATCRGTFNDNLFLIRCCLLVLMRFDQF